MRIFRRFRILLPPGWVIFSAVFFYAACSLPEMLLAWKFGIPRQGNKLRGIGSLLLVVAFGLYRVVAFHPFYRASYRQWLESTPWTRKKPLPVGPVRLVWEDAAILATIWIPSAIEKDFPSPFVLPIVFLSAYSLALAPSLIATGSWLSGFAILYGLGASLFLQGDIPIVAELTAALYLIGQFGLWNSLGRFPWDHEWIKRANAAMKLQASKDVSQLQEKILGWPFDSLSPKAGEPGSKTFSKPTVILTCVLVGWWVAAFASVFSGPNVRLEIYRMTAIYGTSFSLFKRVMTYLDGFSPPINLWGRLRTFRWIIPGYDQVLIAPLLIAVAGWLVPFELARLGLPHDAAFPIGLSLSLLIAALAGPNLQTWRLTGNHRIGPRAVTMSSKGEIVKLG